MSDDDTTEMWLVLNDQAKEIERLRAKILEATLMAKSACEMVARMHQQNETTAAAQFVQRTIETNLGIVSFMFHNGPNLCTLEVRIMSNKSFVRCFGARLMPRDVAAKLTTFRVPIFRGEACMIFN